MRITDKLHQRRKYLGMTLDDVSVKLGVNRGTVSRWESGITSISLDRASEYAMLLGVELVLIDLR